MFFNRNFTASHPRFWMWVYPQGVPESAPPSRVLFSEDGLNVGPLVNFVWVGQVVTPTIDYD